MKYIEVYQNGVIKKIPYWDYIMQRAIEHRIKEKKK